MKNLKYYEVLNKKIFANTPVIFFLKIQNSNDLKKT